MFMFMLGNFHLNNVLQTNYFAKGLVAELILLHVQGAWGLEGKEQVARLAAYCNYLSKKNYTHFR